MTVVSLQADTGNTKPCEFERLYRAWLYAKAQWDLAENDPNNPDGLTPEETDAFCDTEHSALMAFFLHPTSDPKHIARKLRVYRDVRAWEFSLVKEVVDQLSRDVHNLAFGHNGD